MGIGTKTADAGVPRVGGAPRVAIIGAGAAGLGMAMQLKAAGYASFVLYEAADRPGGTWRANIYPGAACDIPSHLYSFSFAPNPNWSRKYVRQPEIEAYFERCAADHGIVPHIRFNTEIRSARYDEAAACWRLSIADGNEETADILVSACGQLNRPHIPDFQGRTAFKGMQFHSARWDPGAVLAGKSVAVIGSAASAIQIVPEIAQQADRLLVFQRSPNWIARKRDRKYSDFERRLNRHVPGLMRLIRGYQFWRHEMHYLAYRQRSGMGALYKYVLGARIRRKVHDPVLRAAVTPDYQFGCKRVQLSNKWFSTLERPNVELVTSPIARFTANAIETADGRTHPIDTVIYATGFEATRFLAPMRIEGLGNRTLDDIWSDGAHAHRGVTVAGFPNLFLLYGPNTNLGHNSILFMLECQARYIISCIDALVDRGVAALAVKPDAMASFNDRLQRRLSRSVWAMGCSNWYKTASGKITNNWSGPAIRYWWQTRRLDLGEYELSGSRDWRSAEPASTDAP